MNGGNDMGLTPEELHEIIESERKRIDAFNDPKNVSEFAREFVKELRRISPLAAADQRSDEAKRESNMAERIRIAAEEKHLRIMKAKAEASVRAANAAAYARKVADQLSGDAPVNFADDSEYIAQILAEDDVPVPALPVDYLANPVRVQLPEGQTTGLANNRRSYAELDLIALCELVTGAKAQNRQLVHELQALSSKHDQLNYVVTKLTTLLLSPRVHDFLTTLAESGKVTDETDEDLF